MRKARKAEGRRAKGTIRGDKNFESSGEWLSLRGYWVIDSGVDWLKNKKIITNIIPPKLARKLSKCLEYLIARVYYMAVFLTVFISGDIAKLLIALYNIVRFKSPDKTLTEDIL